MSEAAEPRSSAKRAGVTCSLVMAMGVMLVSAGAGWLLGRFSADPEPPAVVETVKAGPAVITAVRDLARLQTAQYHMERVVDVRQDQRILKGLIEAQDAILLVAAADVTAGVDLKELADKDVVVDHDAKRVRIELPEPEILSAALDNQRTYVYSRDTDLLAKRSTSLETDARRAAEKQLVDAAIEAGIKRRAADNARTAVTRLVRSLGFDDVQVTVRGFEDDSGSRRLPGASR